MVTILYIEAVCGENNLIEVNLETLLVIYVYRICDTDSVNLKVVCKNFIEQPLFKIDISQVKSDSIDHLDILKIATFCIWPVIVVGNTVVSGLCSVARQIIKSSGNEAMQSLLGFKEACLMACNESSIWTKFCEIDITATVKDVIVNPNNFVRNGTVQIPLHLTKFEYHMQQPVRTHNVYKLAREKHNDKSIKSSIPLDQLNLAHIFSEGTFMTLSDILLFPCFKILVHMFSLEFFKNELPLSLAWFENMQIKDFPIIQIDILYTPLNIESNFILEHENIPKQSLYTSDPKRYKPQNRIYTKQIDIEYSLNVIERLDVTVINQLEPFGCEINFDWNSVPWDANPEGGALPKKRANRKCQQLENLARAVLKLCQSKKYKIVDFCSGSGHLGILLATLLSSCEIILVENKERSLVRAKERILKLNLTNITVLQCNLDYFNAKFDLGVSLHACGVATDLVIQNCIKNKAHFVCCPCCYGGIHDCFHLKYPRSKEFINLNLSYKDYLSIAHAADQTHDSDNVKTKQGYVCMDIIDNDRKLQAESFGYTVHLGKLQPISCTPKNNLLVGVYSIKL